MRLLNLLLVCLAGGALVSGAYVLGSKVRDDANEELRSTISVEAAAATAESNLRPALYAASAYFVDHATYAGMTAAALRSDYNPGLAQGLRFSDTTASGFCVEIEIDGRTFSYLDRGASIVPGDGC